MSINVALVSWRFRKRPFTSLHTDLTITVLDEYGATAKVERDQLLRVNQPGVTAYRSNSSANAPNGKICFDKISCSAKGPSYQDGNKFLVNGTDKGVEIFQRFGKPLPYNPFFPLIPKFLLKILGTDHNYLINHNIIRRYQSIEYDNEYDIEEPEFNLTIVRTPHESINVKMVFLNGSEPLDVKGFFIQGMGVKDLDIRKDPAESASRSAIVYSVKLRMKTATRVWIIWKNKDPQQLTLGLKPSVFP